MDEYLGIIKLFAGIYAPEDYMLCHGQTLSIANYTSLYSILGTNFGGDGRQTFNLPDLRGRVPVGVGQFPGPNHSNFMMGQTGGEETVTLEVSQMPVHSHSSELKITGGVGGITGTVTATMKVNSTDGSLITPYSNYLGTDNSFSGNYSSTTDNATLNVNSINVDSSQLRVVVTNFSGSLTIGETGGTQPHLNMQPFVAINWIICVNGLYPPRN